MGLLTRFIRQPLSELIVSPELAARLRKKYYDRDQGGWGGGGALDVSYTPTTITNAPAGMGRPMANLPGTRSGTPQTSPSPGTNSGTPTAPTSNATQFQPSGSRFVPVGDTSHISPVLLNTLQSASGYLPDGYTVRMTSGERPGAHVGGGGGVSQHASGNAVDVQIHDPNGNAIPNRGDDTTGMYGRLARAGYHVLNSTNPDAARKLAWGGNFDTGVGSGVRDLMHYDLGGDRGRYGRLGQQFAQYSQQDNFAPYKSDQPNTTPNAAPSTTSANPQTASNTGTSSWTPGNYPNAPIESKQSMSHPERNNPGNLRVGPNDWVGKVTPQGSPFEHFDTVENGIRARALTYGSYLNRGVNTIDQISKTSGPANDGNDIASQNQAYRQALGGKYLQPGGENLPIDQNPENIRRLTAGGISIEAGGQGKWMPKGINMGVIDNVVGGLSQAGHFSQPSSTQVASNQSPPTSTSASGSSTPPSLPLSTPTAQSVSSTPSSPPPTSTSASGSQPAQNTGDTSNLVSGVKPITTASLDTKTPTSEGYRRPAINLLRPN